MKKILFFIIGLAIILYAGYKYFDLDQNQEFNTAIQSIIKGEKTKDAEIVIKNAIFESVQTKAKEYFKEHNGYLVSKTNSICTSVQSLFNIGGAVDIIKNPIECSAQKNTFTARLKSRLTKTYYCADSTGVYTTTLDEPGFEEGVKCK